ncbi:hypothetical protein D3C72_2485280 [compost metagenome]
MLKMISQGLEDTVPARRNMKFISMPKNAAATVKVPRMSPSPTRNSPHGIKKLNNLALGKAKCSRNETKRG